jgi:N-acylneuraminate cytidylyltransferase
LEDGVSLSPVLAVIPARGGSKGLPGKNIRGFMGLPLIAHTIRFAAMVPQIARCIVSTDSQEIADVARQHGAEVPFLRPAELAQDDSPMWPVLQHALREMEQRDRRRYESVLLLDPTSPGRLPEDVAQALRMLEEDAKAVGVVAVSEPHFNPRWVCVEERNGYLAHAFESRSYTRRQEVPTVYRVNALLYLWRRQHVAESPEPQWDEAPHRMMVVPEERAVHIDELHDFELGEILVKQGLVRFPWLDKGQGQ